MSGAIVTRAALSVNEQGTILEVPMYRTDTTLKLSVVCRTVVQMVTHLYVTVTPWLRNLALHLVPQVVQAVCNDCYVLIRSLISTAHAYAAYGL